MLSGFAEVSGSLYDWFDWKREECWEVCCCCCWGGDVYTCRYDVYVCGDEADVYSYPEDSYLKDKIDQQEQDIMGHIANKNPFT